MSASGYAAGKLWDSIDPATQLGGTYSLRTRFWSTVLRVLVWIEKR